MLGQRKDRPDKTRLCPSCRSEISVLATKCKYCGEEVGRPRDEARQLSITELGGERQAHYAPSDNVLEALEAFRAEVMGEAAAAAKAKAAKRRRFLRRKRGEDSSDSDSSDSPPPAEPFPELDERSQALASLSLPSKPEQPAGRRTPPWRKTVYIFGAFVSAVVVLFFGVTKGAAMIREYLARQDVIEPVQYVNRAPEILERGGPLIDALESTLRAYRQNPTSENERITAEVRQLISDEIDRLLNAYPWEMAYLEEASLLASRAVRMDPCEVMLAKEDEVSREVFAYKMTYLGVTKPGNKAKFRLYDPEAPVKTVFVQEGESLRGRFIVRRIREDRVTVDDTRRPTPGGRPRRIEFVLGGKTRPAG